MVKNVNDDVFREWMDGNSLPKLKKFCRVLKICVSNFAYRGKDFYKNSGERRRKADEVKQAIKESIRKRSDRAKGEDAPMGEITPKLTKDFKEQLGNVVLTGQKVKMMVRKQIKLNQI